MVSGPTVRGKIQYLNCGGMAILWKKTSNLVVSQEIVSDYTTHQSVHQCANWTVTSPNQSPHRTWSNKSLCQSQEKQTLSNEDLLKHGYFLNMKTLPVEKRIYKSYSHSVAALIVAVLALLSRTLGRVRKSKDFGLGQIWLQCCSKHNSEGEWLGLALSGRMCCIRRLTVWIWGVLYGLGCHMGSCRHGMALG